MGEPYDDVPIDQVQEKDLQGLPYQHPAQVQPVAALSAWSIEVLNHSIQKICVFSLGGRSSSEIS